MTLPAEELKGGGFERGVLVGGRYRIEAPLGHGGAGAVYRVFDERDERVLALKQLRANDDQHKAVLAMQFEREYHTLAQLAHPHIIAVYDYGVEEGAAYYTMELLDGEDLSERGKLPWKRACAILRDVASSLAVLHSRRLLHRDVSARNVRCTADDTAKLIDFGAMVPMGVAKHLVGTPPFIPPEATQLQALDARADLYSLGALAYWTLTGRHAYPARTLGQLSASWRNPPASPRKTDPEIPEALDRLVMELLQLDRAGRPQTAAEVIERLSGIAQLPLREDAAVVQAYLQTPSLVGRDAALAEVRSALAAAAKAHGNAVMIEGAPGSGRSRFLDACLLEAKLLGAVVLRADASDAAQGEYGVMRALCNQLLRAIPELAKHGVQPPQQAVLGHVIPIWASLRDARSERRHIQGTLRDWVLSIARHRHLVLAVDDLEGVDEPSAAVLGALAHRAQRRELSLLLTLRQGARTTPVLGLLREVAQSITLAPLQPAQTEALLRSVFGDAPHVAALAARIHGLAEGNPQSTMELAQHLCERGIARYEAGSFKLPQQLRPGDLPDSMTAAFASRVAVLSSDALELACALSLDDAAALPVLEYPSLTTHQEHARTYQAIDALVARGVLVAAEDRYCFSHESVIAPLRSGLSAERKRELHLRLAGALGRCDNPLRVAEHLLLGGREREGIELLLRLDQGGMLYITPQRLELLERAHQAAVTLQLPARSALVLARIIAMTAAYFGDAEVFARHAPPLLARLRSDCGIDDWLGLPASMEPGARSAQAIGRAEQRFAGLPEVERGYPPPEAAMLLAMLSSGYVAVAAVTQDLGLLTAFPPLDPLAPIFPGVWLAQAHVSTSLALFSGHYEKVLPICYRLLAGYPRLELSALARVYAERVRYGTLYTIGLFIALSGAQSTSERVAELEKVPGQRVNAARVRMVAELMQGDVEAAHDSQRRAELLALQDGAAIALPGTTLRVELQAYVAMDDLIGVKRTMERIEPLAASYPGWRSTLALARCHYRRLQGDFAGALEELAPSLAWLDADPERHFDWGLAADAHLLLLLSLGRNEQALASSSAYLHTCKRLDLPAVRRELSRTVALVLAGSGRFEQALATIEAHIEQQQQVGSKGLRLGLAYESRARIAIAMGDHEAVKTYAELCARAYKGARNTLLSGRYERLIRSAEEHGIPLSSSLQRAAELSVTSVKADPTDTLHSRLQTCIGPAERAQVGLSLLLESSGASLGYLFGLRTGQLELLSSSDGSQPGDELLETLELYVRNEFEAEDSATVLASRELAAPALQRWADPWGREFEPMLLFSRKHNESTVAGVAALHYEGDERPLLRRGVLEALTEALVEVDAVDPVTYVL